MKIGYPTINTSIGCTANTTFRLRSYSEGLLKQKISNNLNCLMKILKYNLENEFLFFRISSDIVPFASHQVNKFNWQGFFKESFNEIGEFIKENDMRISMHPDQFVLINAIKQDIVERSIKELEYHCDVLDLMKLDEKAKVQIHVGGVYGDKESAIKRFVDTYKKLPEKITKRLVIENDERLFSLKDCLEISKKTNIPILFDNFHHTCLNSNESFDYAISLAEKTWKKKDGILMTDYSSQQQGKRNGSHTQSINSKNFTDYIKQVIKYDFDVMLEIKDKEKSALKALKILKKLKKI